MALANFEDDTTEVTEEQFWLSPLESYKYQVQHTCTVKIFTIGMLTAIDATTCKSEKRRVQWLADRMKGHKTQDCCIRSMNVFQCTKRCIFRIQGKCRRTS